MNPQELMYRAQINRAVRFILENLSGEIPLQDIAGAAGFSPYHFHRIFSAFVGETLGSYIRRLRIERSLFYLQHTKRTITQIAMEAGFSSGAAFSKAFSQYYGRPPSAFRRGTDLPEPVTRLETIKSERKFKMKPRIMEVPDQRVVIAEAKGLDGNTFTGAADKAFDKLCAYVTRNHLWGRVGDCLGICPDDPASTPQEESRYLAGFVLKPDVHIEETNEIKVISLQGGKFAVFRHMGPYDNLWQTWNAAYRDWLPASGLKLRDEMPYEVYLDDKHKTSPENLRTDIYIAIE